MWSIKEWCNVELQVKRCIIGWGANSQKNWIDQGCSGSTALTLVTRRPVAVLTTVQDLQLFSTYNCSGLTTVQYLKLFRTYNCSVLKTVQDLQLFSTYNCLVLTTVQYLQLFRTYHCSGLTTVQYLQLFRTYNCSAKCHEPTLLGITLEQAQLG